MTKEQSCNCHSFMSDVNILCMTAEFIVWQTSVATTGAVRECCFLCKFILSLRLSCRNTPVCHNQSVKHLHMNVYGIQLEYEISILFLNCSFHALHFYCIQTFQQVASMCWCTTARSYVLNIKVPSILIPLRFQELVDTVLLMWKI